MAEEQGKKRKRKLRIVLRIGPLGLKNELWPPEVKFVDRPQYLPAVTRGEGQALQFVLEDSDCSGPFYEALQNLGDGELLAFLQSQQWVLVKAPEPTMERCLAQVRALDQELEDALESGRLTATPDEQGILEIKYE